MKKIVFFAFLSCVANTMALCQLNLLNDSNNDIWVTKVTQPDGGDQIKTDDEFFKQGVLLKPGYRIKVSPQYIYVQEGEIFKKRYVLTPPFTKCPVATAIIKFSTLIEGKEGIRIIDMTTEMY